MALKLDMRKTYDRAKWDYFEVITRKSCLQDQWIDKIIRCVCFVSF